MTTTHRPRRSGSPAAAGVYFRVAGGAGLLAVCAVGAAARPSVQLQLRHPDVVSDVAVLLMTVAAALAAAVLVLALRSGRRRRREDKDYQHVASVPRSRLAQTAAVGLVVVVLIGPAALLIVANRHAAHHASGATPTLPAQPTAATNRTTPAPSRRSHRRDGAASTTEIAVTVAAVLVAGSAAVYAGRRIRQEDLTAAPPVQPQPDASPDADAVQQTVRAGAVAMAGIEQTRAAILTCYAAMEHRLATQGIERYAAQTPTELLNAGIGSGLLIEPPARTLLKLFQRARFGDEPMTETDRRCAVETLAQLSTEPVGRS